VNWFTICAGRIELHHSSMLLLSYETEPRPTRLIRVLLSPPLLVLGSHQFFLIVTIASQLERVRHYIDTTRRDVAREVLSVVVVVLVILIAVV